MSLIAELKRRNVFKVTTAYLALGWVVLESSGTVASVLRLPDWTSSFLFWLGLAGLPFVVVFAWVFELTPEGLQRTTEVAAGQSITHVTSKRLDYVIVGMLAVAIGLFVLQYLRPPAPEAPATATEVVETPAAPTTLQADPSPLPQPAQAIAPDDKSIAVLPFVNMSSDKEQEYFSDGMSEELLNLLAKIPELKVIARTSSFAFKGKDVPIAEIARQLNVAHVLEGSVRKSGNTVRITAQLIRTADSTHLWSETYDRPLDDIFGVQDEISGAVVEQLKIKLLGAAPKAEQVNPEAYTLYLQAAQQHRRATPEGLEQAIALLQQALVLDRGYATAWAQLGNIYVTQAVNSQRPIEEAYTLAREAVETAMASDPDLALAHVVSGSIAAHYNVDLAAAAQHYQRALILEPGNPGFISVAGLFAHSIGRLDLAIVLGEWAIARDPLNSYFYSNVHYSYLARGRFDDAAVNYRTIVHLMSDPSISEISAEILLLKGEAGAALAAVENETDARYRLAIQAAAYHSLGEAGKSDAAISRLIQEFSAQATFDIAVVHAWRGEIDQAFERLGKMAVHKDPSVFLIPTDPFLAPLHSDPRWLPFLRRIGRAPEQLAAIKFDVKLPQQ